MENKLKNNDCGCSGAQHKETVNESSIFKKIKRSLQLPFLKFPRMPQYTFNKINQIVDNIPKAKLRSIEKVKDIYYAFRVTVGGRDEYYIYNTKTGEHFTFDEAMDKGFSFRGYVPTVSDNVNEFQRDRQLRNPDTEMLVVKNGKVQVIDKKDWKKYKSKGYLVAEKKSTGESVNEAKALDFIVTSIPSSKIAAKYLPKADVGMGLSMYDKLGKGYVLTYRDYTLDYRKGKVALVLSRTGKQRVKAIMSKDSTYLQKLQKFANDYLSKFAKDIKESVVNEARRKVKLGVIHKAAKKGSFPVSLVVVKNSKVIDQDLVNTPEAVPAAFKVIQRKHKGAIIHIEDSTGRRLLSFDGKYLHTFESVNEAVKKGKKYGDWTVIQYEPVKYDDYGAPNGGRIKIVNQKTGHDLLIQNDLALRGSKWYISVNRRTIKDTNPETVIQKAIKNSVNEANGESMNQQTMSETKFRKGDMVRVVDNPKYVMDKKKFAGKSGYVRSIYGRDMLVTFPNGKTILVDPKDLEMNPYESVNEFDLNEKKYKTTATKSELKTAYELGVKAFNRGKKRAPMLDKKLMNMLKGKEVADTSSIDIMDAWLKAWDTTNLKAPVGESVNEGISVFDERHFGKKGIIIMIDDNGKKVSAIFKDKKNADKYNRNKESDLKALLQLAKKTPYPKAIDEGKGDFGGWVAIYKGKRLEIDKSEANGIYGAKQIAIKKLKVPKSKQSLLAIAPAVEESVNESSLPIVDKKYGIAKVDDGKGNTWYVKKIDSTHMFMANDPKYLKKDRPTGVMAHHIGQHRDEPYYSELRSWLKESVNEAATRRSEDFFDEYKHGKEIRKMLKGTWNTSKVKKYLDTVGGSDIKWARIMDDMANRLGLDHRRYNNRPMNDMVNDILDKMEKLYSIHMSESVNESDVNEMKYSNQTGIKSSLLKNNEFNSLLNPKEMRWIKGNDVKIYKDRFGFTFTDGKREMVFHLKKPYSVVKPLGNARSEIKKVYQQNESVVNEADVVGKGVFSDGKGKLVFGYYKDDDGVTFVDYKTWAKLNMKDVSKGDTNKDRVIKAILKNQKQFNKKVDYNMWEKKNRPSFEEKMNWFIKNGWISNITKRGIKESVNETKDLVTLVKGRTFDLGRGHFPTGLVVYNRAEEENGDWKKLAHISHKNNKITWYDKKLPRQIKSYIETLAKKHKGYNESVNESVNESIIATLAVLGTGVISVFALLQLLAALKFNAHRNDFKDAHLRYNDLLAWWSPKDFIKAWKLVKKDKKVLKIVNRLKNDDDVKEFLKNPKQAGWQKMLAKKLDASEMGVIKSIYKRHFHDDVPKMNSWDSRNESVNESTEPQIITQLRDVMENGYQKLKDPKTGRKVMVDSFSASAMVKVYDGLKNPSVREKYVNSGLFGMQKLAFKFVK